MVARAFITGITGMVGSHLADYLLENTDWNIVGFAGGAARWTISSICCRALTARTASNLYTAICAMRSPCVIASMRRSRITCSIWRHNRFPRTSFDAPIETLDTNVNGTCNLLEAIRGSGLSRRIFTYAPLPEVFGRVPKEKVPIDEECTFHPASPYAISKVGTDLLGRFYAEAYGMKVMVTRMFTHTGPRRGDVFAESSFAKQIAMIEANVLPPVVKVGNLDSLRTLPMCATRYGPITLLLTVNPQPGAYYNIGGTYTCTVGDMLDTLLCVHRQQHPAWRSIHDRLAADRRRSSGAEYREVRRAHGLAAATIRLSKRWRDLSGLLARPRALPARSSCRAETDRVAHASTCHRYSRTPASHDRRHRPGRYGAGRGAA